MDDNAKNVLIMIALISIYVVLIVLHPNQIKIPVHCSLICCVNQYYICLASKIVCVCVCVFSQRKWNQGKGA